MSRKHLYITLTVFIAIAMSSYVLIRANKNISPSELTSAAVTTTNVVRSPEVKPPEKPRSPARTTMSASTSAAATTSNGAAAPNVTLSVAGNSYAAFAPQGSTALDAMRIVASATDFVFSGKEYPSLGFFVDSINGQKAVSGYNWILYVNGKLSGTGASQTTLNAGDAIEWRYEKNY